MSVPLFFPIALTALVRFPSGPGDFDVIALTFLRAAAQEDDDFGRVALFDRAEVEPVARPEVEASL